MRRDSRSGSGFRRSRCPSGSASASSSSPARASRTRCSSACLAPSRPTWASPRRRRSRRLRKSGVSALASPASCKGVLSALEAAMALAAGMRGAGLEADELPVADGGEGTAEVFAAALGGEWRSAPASDPLGRAVEARYLVLEDGSAVVEAAEAVGFRLLGPGELDPLAASSGGLGELLAAIAPDVAGAIPVGLGDTATVDGGAGLFQGVGDALTGRDVEVLCDVRNPLLGERGAARAFGPQKGASPEQVDVLEARLAAIDELRPFAELPGAGAAGGLGAALASLGGRLVPGAAVVLERIDFAGPARD